MAAESIVQFLLPHWPFVFAAFSLGGIGATMKMAVWTRERALRNRFFFWGRALMPLHAIVAGVTFALLAQAAGGAPVSPGVHGTPSVVLYYAAAGMASSHVYATAAYLLRNIRERRFRKQVESAVAREQAAQTPEDSQP